jgi:hypothetical protein
MLHRADKIMLILYKLRLNVYVIHGSSEFTQWTIAQLQLYFTSPSYNNKPSAGWALQQYRIIQTVLK